MRTDSRLTVSWWGSLPLHADLPFKDPSMQTLLHAELPPSQGRPPQSRADPSQSCENITSPASILYAVGKNDSTAYQKLIVSTVEEAIVPNSVPFPFAFSQLRTGERHCNWFHFTVAYPSTQ